MANSNLLNYAMIIIAISTSPISAQFRRSNPKLLNAIVDAYKSDPIDNQDQQPYFTNFPQTRPANKALRNILFDYPILCEVKITKGDFGDDSYFPRTYYNKTCSHTSKDPQLHDYSNHIEKPEFCFHNNQAFGCETQTGNINVVKRSTSGNQECWEYFTQEVGVGCKCNVNYRYTNE